jgi:hypothetical protein
MYDLILFLKGRACLSAVSYFFKTFYNKHNQDLSVNVIITSFDLYSYFSLAYASPWCPKQAVKDPEEWYKDDFAYAAVCALTDLFFLE